MSFEFNMLSGGDMNLHGPSATVKYRATGVGAVGVDAFDFVAAYAMTNVPQFFDTATGRVFLGDIQIHENHYARSYDVTCPYSVGGMLKRSAGAYQITVDQTGGTVNVKAGRRIAGYGADADKVDNGGLIGVEGDDVKGVDVPVDQTKVTVNFRHPQGVLNRAYVRRVGRLVGYPNNDKFLGYDPGEVLFKGGNFQESNTESTATYNFDISFNRTNFVVGGITVTSKKGWDVLSSTFKDAEHNNGVAVVPIKRLSYIEIIRPAGREWEDYVPAFGWGG